MQISIIMTLIPTSSNPKCLFVAASKLKLKKLEQRSECEEGWREGPIRHSRSENSPSSYLTGGRTDGPSPSFPRTNLCLSIAKVARVSFLACVHGRQQGLLLSGRKVSIVVRLRSACDRFSESQLNAPHLRTSKQTSRMEILAA